MFMFVSKSRIRFSLCEFTLELEQDNEQVTSYLLHWTCCIGNKPAQLNRLAVSAVFVTN